MSRILEIEDLVLSYGAAQAVRGLSMHIEEGEVVTLIGANGAGKSTTLKGIVGLIRPGRGDIRFGGTSIVGRSTDRLAREGLNLVPEGRRVFPGLTVTENLDVASAAQIRDALVARARAGAAVLISSEELDESLEIANRILVMHRGRIVAERDPTRLEVDELGRLVTTGAG